MNKITIVTRRKIIDLFKNGIYSYSLGEVVYLPYNGRISEIEFLSRFFTLDIIESNDARCKNFKSEIEQHRMLNHDWDDDWCFHDKRLNLIECKDQLFLDFIEYIFHPEVRVESSCWRDFFDCISEIIKNDGYECYVCGEVSKEKIYAFRKLSPMELNDGRFYPFSLRNKERIKSGKIKLRIPLQVRLGIIEVFEAFNEETYKYGETNLTINIMPLDEIIPSLKEYYTPCAYDNNNRYCSTENIIEFLKKTSPYCVFDAIEIYSQLKIREGFESAINKVLAGLIGFRLLDKRIMLYNRNQVKNTVAKIEIDLDELIKDAENIYNSSTTLEEKKDAVEKIWDALERMKSLYSDSKKEKKDSITFIISKISDENEYFKHIFDNEFAMLSKIGNECNIRHHEVYINKIPNQFCYDYLFKRCHALISYATKFLR